MARQQGHPEFHSEHQPGDLLEHILDKGIVITSNIKIRLMKMEVLTLQTRLVICSVDKAKELGINWWVANPAFSPHAPSEELAASLARIDERFGQAGICRGRPVSSSNSQGTVRSLVTQR